MILPVLNEEHHLAESVRGVVEQDYPGALEVILALGPSKDGTDKVAQLLIEGDRRIRSVRSPVENTSVALNLAIEASCHDVIARLDAHAVFGPDYLRTAATVMASTGADVVGGGMLPEATDPTGLAIAAAMASPFGVGHVAFRTGGLAGPADSVYLGVFRKSTLRKHDGFDERFFRAQDWELNYRIRRTGGHVWFSPEISSRYRPRRNLRALARQYYEYGRWRRVLARRYPDTVTPRYMAAPVAAIGVAAGFLLIVLGRRIGWVGPLAYTSWVAVGTLTAGSRTGMRAACRLPLTFATMHWSWAAGFLTSPWRLVERTRTDWSGQIRCPSDQPGKERRGPVMPVPHAVEPA